MPFRPSIKKHKCSAYCNERENIHAILVLACEETTCDSLKHFYLSWKGVEQGDFILVREASEYSLEEVRKRVFVRSELHVKPFIMVLRCYPMSEWDEQ